MVACFLLLHWYIGMSNMDVVFLFLLWVVHVSVLDPNPIIACSKRVHIHIAFIITSSIHHNFIFAFCKPITITQGDWPTVPRPTGPAPNPKLQTWPKSIQNPNQKLLNSESTDSHCIYQFIIYYILSVCLVVRYFRDICRGERNRPPQNAQHLYPCFHQ